MRLFQTTLTLLVIAMPFHSSGQCESKLKCGDEFRVLTVDGTKIQGRLASRDGDTLTLNSGTKIAMSDMKSIYHIRRHGLAGVLAGAAFGTIVGVVIARKVNDARPSSGGFVDFDLHIAEGVAIILGGTVVFAITGALIGHHRPSYKKVNIDILPLCSSHSGKVTPLALRFTMNF